MRIFNIRGLLFGRAAAIFNRPENIQIPAKKHQIWGPKKVPPGAPGRGVLRFWRPGYRNPVHILAIFRVFSKNRQT